MHVLEAFWQSKAKLHLDSNEEVSSANNWALSNWIGLGITDKCYGTHFAIRLFLKRVLAKDIIVLNSSNQQSSHVSHWQL
jgi:hypothetical protein